MSHFGALSDHRGTGKGKVIERERKVNTGGRKDRGRGNGERRVWRRERKCRKVGKARKECEREGHNGWRKFDKTRTSRRGGWRERHGREWRISRR